MLSCTLRSTVTRCPRFTIWVHWYMLPINGNGPSTVTNPASMQRTAQLRSASDRDRQPVEALSLHHHRKRRVHHQNGTPMAAANGLMWRNAQGPYD
jgi:hypothetical protein